MSRVISLVTLFLSGLASAQDPLVATSGSMVVQFGDQTAPYTVAGPEFSASGVILAWALEDLLNYPVGNGPNSLVIQGDTGNPNLDNVSLTLHGVPWVIPPDGGAVAAFSTDFVFTGAGMYRNTFTYSGFFQGVPLSEQSAHPGEGCGGIVLSCTNFVFEGFGTAVVDVVPSSTFPGALQIEQATFTLERVPEPPIAPLLALGFAGLGILGHRRTTRVIPRAC
ncbi:MAG TPA: hypothetical protein VMT66_07410 [Steroidobacteraceae bacterium]|nr:hypothetical protein [Steroidobacteraceae bacterium]